MGWFWCYRRNVKHGPDAELIAVKPCGIDLENSRPKRAAAVPKFYEYMDAVVVKNC